MSVRVRKRILIGFATVTTVLAIVSCYTLYLYFGVTTATRMMEFSLLDFDVFQMSDIEISIKTYLRIHNPSEFTFHVVWVNEKLYNRTDYIPVGEIGGYWSAGTPAEVPPFSNVTLTISTGGLQVAKGQTTNLYLLIIIGLDTPLTTQTTVDFYEEVSFNT